MIGNGGGTRLPVTTMTVSSETNRATAAAMADGGPVSTRRTSSIQTSANAETTADAPMATFIHGGAAAAIAQPNTITAAATVPAACTVIFRVTRAVALVARVTTASVAKSGHGGTDQSRLTATNRRNKWPMSERNRPLLNPPAGTASCLRSLRCAHA